MSSSIREEQNLSTAREFLKAIERGGDADSLTPFLHPDIVQREFPNRLLPQGKQRDLRGMLRSFEQGKQVMKAQRFEIHNALAAGDQVALEVSWSGTLAVEFGSLAAGSEMRASFGVFLEFREGRIVAQRNYDCFEPW